MWDELKDIFTGPVGPWIGLLGLVVISLLWLEGERLLYTPIAFAWATLIVARHFDFVVLDQYMLMVAVYFGVYYAMPHWEILKPPSTDALKKEPETDRPEAVDWHAPDVEFVGGLAFVLGGREVDVGRVLVGIAAPARGGAHQPGHGIDLTFRTERILEAGRRR